MKYLNWFKGFVVIALACSVTAQGSTVDSSTSKSDPQTTEVSSAYSVSVTAGQLQNDQSTANLTISGENSRVSTNNAGTVKLVASESIVLRPGTRVTAGGFLYASIEPVSKSGKQHHKKVVVVVTVEEKMKMEAQASLAMAYTIFSPFPSPVSRHVHSGDAENGSFTSSINELSAVSPEQQRKVAVDSRILTGFFHKQISTEFNTAPGAYSYRRDVMRVLRL
jgi:hypothetical protein